MTNTLNSLLIAAIGILLVFSGWNWWRLHQLTARMSAALGGLSGDLEKNLKGYLKQVDSVTKELERLNQAYSELTTMTSLASQKISVVRFNPFADSGGDQSFALAVLDAHNSGYILSSIHARTGTRVYVKPIDYGKSKYTLSQEEKQAFEQASKRVPAL